MNHWITDHPEAVKNFLPADVSWSRLPQPPPLSLPQKLAGWFNPDKISWICRFEDGGSSSRDRYVVLVDHAGESQFDAAMTVLKQGHELPDGLICLALTGTRFRGQRQRPWSALAGNMHLTAHYELDVSVQNSRASLTMIPAVAAAESIAGMLRGGIVPKIKWVNDVLLDGRKVSGVLTATQVTGENIERAVFGIGINIRQSPEIVATPFVPVAGCLGDFDSSLAGELPRVFERTAQILDLLVRDLRAGKTREIFERYQARAGFIGEDVRVWPEGTENWTATEPVARGKVQALNADLSLKMSGIERPVASGRLAYESVCRSFDKEMK